MIEDDCLIGMGAIVLSGARIGTGSLVGAGALVREGQAMPPGSLAVGPPARVIGPGRPTRIARRSANGAEHYVGAVARLPRARLRAAAPAGRRATRGATRRATADR